MADGAELQPVRIILDAQGIRRALCLDIVVLLQFGTNDEKVSRDQADEMIAIAGPSHEVRWYETEHLRPFCGALQSG